MRRIDNIEELIEKSYLKNLDVPVDAEMDMRILGDAVVRMEETKKKRPVYIKPAVWRMIMKNRRTQLTAAMALIITVLIGIHYLGGSIDGASVAWADVLEQIKSFRPYAYTQTTRYYHTDKTIVRRFMILNPYQRREEFPDGTVRIFDYSKEPTGMLQLNPKTKQAAWKMSSREAGPINNDVLVELRRFEGSPDIYSVEDRGVKNLDGHTTKCFHLSTENFVYTAWVDIETRLPVRIELEQPTFKRTLIMTDFDFNPNFDETQFDRNPPKEYTLSEYPSEEDQISDQSHVFRSRAYTYTSVLSDGSKRVYRYLEPSIDRCRREFDNGQIVIYDYSQEPAKCLKLDPEEKQAVLETYPGGNRKKINIELLKIIENAEAKPELYKVEDRGIQLMDGHTTHCIYIAGMNDEILFTVWKDIDTSLPVRIEQKHSQTLTLIWTDFEFDVAFDPNLFEVKAPEGYTLTEVTYPAKVVQPSEAHLIEGLRFLAEFLGGTFPEALDWPQIQQQMRTYIDENNVEIFPVQLKDMREAIGPFNKYVGRLLSSPKSFDLHYVGDGVRLGEAETVILWYRPEGTSFYRVVYGDLSVVEVAPENLPK